MRRGVRRLLAAAGGLLLLAAGLWFVPGMKFSVFACVGGSAGCVLYAGAWRLADRGRAGRLLWRCLLAGLLALALSFLGVEGALVWIGRQPPPQEIPCAVIVLGAGVNGTRPSLVLSSRLDVAAEYLAGLPAEVPVILSGGQGGGEDVTEAAAMYGDLTARGLEPSRFYQEDRSSTTAENLACSEALLRELGVELSKGKVAVVSNDFHLGRVRFLARTATEMEVFGVAAALPYPWLTVNYYAREYFALVKGVALTALSPE